MTVPEELLRALPRLSAPDALAAIRTARPPRGKRSAAVLILLGPGADGYELVLIEKRADLRSHAGQVAFPGGSLEPGETDPVAAAKIVVEFAKTNDKLEIVGGGMGDVVLDVNGVKALASLPSLDELRAKIIGLVQAPATKVAQIAAAPAGQLARVFGAYAAKEAA